MSTHPWDWKQARDASAESSTAQGLAAAGLRDAAEAKADAERDYRRALAAEIVRTHAAGTAWTVAQDLARGDEDVSALRHALTVAEGVKEAAEQVAWQASADRRDTAGFREWSMRAAFRDEQEPATTSVIGGRRAAA